MYDRSPDGKVKNPFDDFEYKKEIMREADKLKA
jgi:hypothetical protein